MWLIKSLWSFTQRLFSCMCVENRGKTAFSQCHSSHTESNFLTTRCAACFCFYCRELEAVKEFSFQQSTLVLYISPSSRLIIPFRLLGCVPSLWKAIKLDIFTTIHNREREEKRKGKCEFPHTFPSPLKHFPAQQFKNWILSGAHVLFTLESLRCFGDDVVYGGTFEQLNFSFQQLTARHHSSVRRREAAVSCVEPFNHHHQVERA